MAAPVTSSIYDRMQEVKQFDESKIGVKGLSDSGSTTIPPFFIHSPEILADLKSSPKTDVEIPLIDLANINSHQHRPNLINQIKEAAKTWGFFQVINHGTPISVINSTIQAIQAFHEQPQEVKAKYYTRDKGHGVLYCNNNDLYQSEAASWHDSLQAWMGPQPLDVEKLPEICRKEVVAWDLCATKVAEAVMELLSEGLRLEANKFKQLTFSESRILVGLCYPHCPRPDLTTGITSHTDAAMLTVLVQNQVPGLQVKHGDGWVDVKPVHGGLIINVGDFLQIVSNGEYNSVQHRVLANGSKEARISIVEFFNLSKWKGSGYYGPLPELLTPEKPAIYRDFTEKEFMENLYSKGFDSKGIIEKIKIEN